jgi:hypothetical protein
VFNLPLGFADAVAPSLPHSYGGVRWLLIKNHFGQSTLLALAAANAMLGLIVWTLCRLVVAWDDLQHRQRLILGCCALALVFDSFPLIFWDPLYDKLWLQPIAVVILAWSVIFEVWPRHGRSCPMRLLPETLLMSIIVVTGLLGAFEAHQSATPCLDRAKN